jgi:hypothetical protein
MSEGPYPAQRSASRRLETRSKNAEVQLHRSESGLMIREIPGEIKGLPEASGG